MIAQGFTDNAAVRALAAANGALCTIVAIEGSYSRRIGAQLAVLEDGSIVGSLADGCLEAQLAHEARNAAAGTACLRRFGKGSPLIDFRLPCGAGIDVVIDPQPDRPAIESLVNQLDRRRSARLSVSTPAMPMPFVRHYRPELRVVILGSGPEAQALAHQANAFGLQTELMQPRNAAGGELTLYQPADVPLDKWTAVVALFHDHAWESGVLPWALASEAFYVGAQGGWVAREQRKAMLTNVGLLPSQSARLRSPVGLIGHARDPAVLALSILAEIVRDYEALVDRDSDE